MPKSPRRKRNDQVDDVDEGMGDAGVVIFSDDTVSAKISAILSL